MKKKVLVTGAGGYIGRHAVVASCDAGAEVFTINHLVASEKNLCCFISVDVPAKPPAAVVMHPEVDGIMNCCSGEPGSLANKVEGFIKEHYYSIKLDYEAYPDRPYDSPVVWGDTAKIGRIMRSSPLPEGLS